MGYLGEHENWAACVFCPPSATGELRLNRPGRTGPILGDSRPAVLASASDCVKSSLVSHGHRRGLLMRVARVWLVFAALTAVGFAGCSAIAPRRGGLDSAGGYRYSSRKSKPEKGVTSLFDSWFRAEEPEPPRSPSEWMELEQIRP